MQRSCGLSKAFTFVELLVVIAIIGILSAVLLPALSAAKAQAHSTSCKNHLRQMGLALEMYVHENSSRYPHVGVWWALLAPYYPLQWTNSAYHCPGYKGAITAGTNPGDHDPLGSYAYNWKGVHGYQTPKPGAPDLGLGWETTFPFVVSVAQIKEPCEMFAIGESRFLKETQSQNEADCVFAMFCGFNQFANVLPPRHGKKYNQLYCDGHVGAMDPWVLFNPTNTAAMWNNDHQPHPEFWPPCQR